MKNIIPFPGPNPTTEHTRRPGAGQKLVIHYSLNGRVLCETQCNMTATTRFVELPIPVRHRLMMGAMK